MSVVQPPRRARARALTRHDVGRALKVDLRIFISSSHLPTAAPRSRSHLENYLTVPRGSTRLRDAEPRGIVKTRPEHGLDVHAAVGRCGPEMRTRAAQPRCKFRRPRPSRRKTDAEPRAGRSENFLDVIWTLARPSGGANSK